MPATPEATILAKAEALGAALPTFHLHDRPDAFAAWSDRVAWADSLRRAGKPHADAVAECDRQLGIRRGSAFPDVVPDGLGLGWLAALLNEAVRAIGA